ncbi:hypothetical protein Tco_1143353, partial [Tanacetum coccineum]
MIADIEDRHHGPRHIPIIILSFTHCGNKSILRVLRIILVILPEHPSETIVFHNEDGNPARANIKQALGYRKDGDGDGNSQPHKGVKASANSDVKYSFTSAQDGEPLQDDVRLCLGNDLKKAQDHSQRHVVTSLRGRLLASLSQKTIDDLNISMEEYIRLEEEKAQRRGKTSNWQTTTFGRNEHYYEEEYFTNFEEEFPTIIFRKINTTSFDTEQGMITGEYNGEDSEIEFPVIVLNNTLKSGTLPHYEPTVSAPNENKIDFRISLDESDDEDYTNLYVSFGIPLDPKRYYKDEATQEYCGGQDMAHLPAANQRHPWLRYEVEGYTPAIVHSYEQRHATICSRPVNWVHVLDFASLTPEMRHDLALRLRMVFTREGQQVFVSHAWRRLFEIHGPLVQKFILEFLSTCRLSNTIMDLDTADTLCFYLGRARRRMTWRQLILALGLHTEQEMAEAGGQAPEKVTGVDLFYLRNMDRGTANFLYLLAQYLFHHAKGRKSGARLFRGHFIRRLAAYF